MLASETVSAVAKCVALYGLTGLTNLGNCRNENSQVIFPALPGELKFLTRHLKKTKGSLYTVANMLLTAHGDGLETSASPTAF